MKIKKIFSLSFAFLQLQYARKMEEKIGTNKVINKVDYELTFLNMAITSSREDKALYDNSISSADIDDPAGLGSEREMLKSISRICTTKQLTGLLKNKTAISSLLK